MKALSTSLQYPGKTSPDTIIAVGNNPFDHILCFAFLYTYSGFYVNKCNRSHFDPSPATNHCFSHELFDTLLQASPTLKAAWASATAPRSAQLEETASPLDVMAWMYSQGRGNLAAEGVMPKPQWNAYNLEAYKNFTDGSEASARPSENAHHSYNLFRTQQELSSLQGVEELGAPREW